MPSRVSTPGRAENATLASDEPTVPSSLTEQTDLALGGAETMQPLLAVLDLDGTIVHAHQDCMKPYDFQIGDSSNRLYVHSRPGTSSFLEWLRQSKIQVAIYTAGTAEYASGVVKNLDPRGNLVQRALSRDDCVPHSTRPNVFTKDLTKLRDDMRRIVLVDNSSMSFDLQPENGVLVEDWLGQGNNDMELVRVRSLLEKLVKAQDVREVLKQEPRPESNSPRKFKPCAGCGASMPRGGNAAAIGDPTGRWFCARCWSAWGWPWPMAPQSPAESWWANRNFWPTHMQTPYMGHAHSYHMGPPWSMAGSLPSASSSAGDWKNSGPPWSWQDMQSQSQPSLMPSAPPAPWPVLSESAAERVEESENYSADDFQQFTAASAGA